MPRSAVAPPALRRDSEGMAPGGGTDAATLRCPGCGVAVRRTEVGRAPGGPAAAECVEAFRALLAASYQDASRRSHHQLLVDAYTAQHGGGASRVEAQSVAVCLMTLLLMVERDEDPASGPELHRRMAESGTAFETLAPPRFDGSGPTAAAVLAATDAEYPGALRRWAVEVWSAWTPQREVVLGWLATSTGR